MASPDRIDELDFHVPPSEQGQMVEHAYAIDSERERYIRRVTDRSDRSITWDVMAWSDSETDPDDFEPWNGDVPRGSWVDLGRDKPQ